MSSLAQGTHSIKAAYSGDLSFAASAVASPLVQTVKALPAPGADGPTVEAVKRYGIHMQPTVLAIRFNQELDPASAVSLSNYKITGPGGQLVRIGSVVLDAETNTVTLRPEKRINLHHTYRLTVIGTDPGGVRDTKGILLDGTNTGAPDGNYRCTLGWGNLVLTPAEAKKYVIPGQARPAGVLNHRFHHQSR
jgi:hypothetical protein